MAARIVELDAEGAGSLQQEPLDTKREEGENTGDMSINSRRKNSEGEEARLEELRRSLEKCHVGLSLDVQKKYCSRSG